MDESCLISRKLVNLMDYFCSSKSNDLVETNASFEKHPQGASISSILIADHAPNATDDFLGIISIYALMQLWNFTSRQALKIIVFKYNI